MVPLFLVPAAGFYYIKHSCRKSGEVVLVMDKDYHCCAVKVPAGDLTFSDRSSKASMDLNLTGEECCTNEGNYLKTDVNYTSPSKVHLPGVEIPLILAYNSVQLLFDTYTGVERYAHSPPIILPSREILLQQSVLLI